MKISKISKLFMSIALAIFAVLPIVDSAFRIYDNELVYLFLAPLAISILLGIVAIFKEGREFLVPSKNINMLDVANIVICVLGILVAYCYDNYALKFWIFLLVLYSIIVALYSKKNSK